MSRKICGLLVALLMSLGLVNINTITTASAATACPDTYEVYEGSSIMIDIACFDNSIDKGYTLYDVDQDAPYTQYGYGYAIWQYDDNGEPYGKLLAYDGYAPGTDTISYLTRKGPKEFETGSVDVTVLEVPNVGTSVARKLGNKSAIDEFTSPTSAIGKYRLSVGTFDEPQPRKVVKLAPGDSLRYKTRLKQLDFIVEYKGQYGWTWFQTGQLNNRKGQSVTFKPIATKRPSGRSATTAWGAHRQ